jgi:hypothetical protein
MKYNINILTLLKTRLWIFATDIKKTNVLFFLFVNWRLKSGLGKALPLEPYLQALVVAVVFIAGVWCLAACLETFLLSYYFCTGDILWHLQKCL